MHIPIHLKRLCYFILIFSMLTACSDSNSKSDLNSMHHYSDLNVAKSSIRESADAGTKIEKQTNQQYSETNRKLIKTANLEVETKQFEKTIQQLENSVTEYRGFIDSNHVTGTSILKSNKLNSNENLPSRSANYSIRIPESKLNTYLNQISKIGNVISKTISTEDISTQYIDTETRLKSLTIQEERLLSLLKKSGTLKDIIELEKELANVRYEIESLTTSLKQFDSFVNFSTINLSVIEVATITDTTPPKTIVERISVQFKKNIEALSNGFKNLTVFLIGNSLLILFWSSLLASVYYFTIRARKKYQD